MNEIMLSNLGLLSPRSRAHMEMWLGERQLRAQEQRRWRAAVVAKVREGRFGDLTPEERGWILSALAAECPEVEA